MSPKLISFRYEHHGGNQLTPTRLSGTVLTSFPRRWGKLRPDPSAIHKALRLRLKQAQKGEINSAFDLALAIIDQCSRVFFERPRFGERRPNMVAMFAEAIRGVVGRV